MKTNMEKRITIRLTSEQYESIRSRAETAALSPSTYVRAAAMRHKVTVVPGLDGVAHELKGIGRNLNQIAILAHQGKIQTAYLKETYEQLKNLYDKFYELTQEESR